MNIFIYRPERKQSRFIDPDVTYTIKGQPFSEWARDRQTVYDYKVELLKRKLHHKPKYKVYDYWR